MDLLRPIRRKVPPAVLVVAHCQGAPRLELQPRRVPTMNLQHGQPLVLRLTYALEPASRPHRLHLQARLDGDPAVDAMASPAGGDRLGFVEARLQCDRPGVHRVDVEAEARGPDGTIRRHAVSIQMVALEPGATPRSALRRSARPKPATPQVPSAVPAPPPWAPPPKPLASPPAALAGPAQAVAAPPPTLEAPVWLQRDADQPAGPPPMLEKVAVKMAVAPKLGKPPPHLWP